jgi:hypothetical protein
LQKQLNNLSSNQNPINIKQFKCQNCNKIFEYKDYLFHKNNCSKNSNEKRNINYSDYRNYINKNSNYSNKNSFDFEPEKLKIKIIKGQVKTDELNKPYIEYLLNVNYDDKKNWKLHKKFYHFTNLYNVLNNSYNEFIQFPISISDIFEDLNSKSSFNHQKIKQLEKFINEVAHTDIINTSKPFLKFIELEKNFKGKEELFPKNNELKIKNNNSNILFNEKKIKNRNNIIINDNEENSNPLPGINNRYTKSYLINNNFDENYVNDNIDEDNFEREYDYNDKEEEEYEDEKAVIKSSFMNDMDI